MHFSSRPIASLLAPLPSPLWVHLALPPRCLTALRCRPTSLSRGSDRSEPLLCFSASKQSTAIAELPPLLLLSLSFITSLILPLLCLSR